MFCYDISLTDKLHSDVTTLQQQNGSDSTSNMSNAKLLHMELQTIHTRIDTIEITTDKHDATLSSMKEDMNIQEDVMENYTYYTMRTIDSLNTNFTLQSDTLQHLNDTVAKLNALINANEQNCHSNTAISILQADMNTSKAIIQDYATRITDLESDNNVDRTLILSLETEIISLTANLTSTNTAINDQSDRLSAINDSVIGIIHRINTSWPAKTEQFLGELKTDIATNRANINVTFLIVEDLEERMALGIEKYQNLSLKFTNLEENTMKIKAATQNNSADIVDNTDRIRILHDTFNADLDFVQHLTLNLTSLEAELDTIIAATEDNTDGLALSVLSIEALERDTYKLDTITTDLAGYIFFFFFFQIIISLLLNNSIFLTIT